MIMAEMARQRLLRWNHMYSSTNRIEYHAYMTSLSIMLSKA